MPQTIRRGDRVRVRGQQWQVTDWTDSIVRVRSCDRDRPVERATFIAEVERLDRVPPRPPALVTPSRWRRAVRGVLSSASPSPTSLLTATGATFDLLPFQLEPALAWTRGLGVRFLIADDVGLGKTVQAGLMIAELLDRWRNGRVLVVTPAGLREQWASELTRRFALDVATVDAAALSRLSSATLTGANPWTTSAVAITSIDFVKRAEVMRSLEGTVWDMLVIDEAHALSPRTDRATAAALLASRARVLVLLTATPHNGDTEAYTHLTSLGDANGTFPLLAFRRTRGQAGLDSTRRTVWLRVRPSAAEGLMHQALIAYARAIWTGRGRTDPAARLAAIVLTKRACSSAAALSRTIQRRLDLLGESAPRNQDQLGLPFSAEDVDDFTLAAPGLDDRADERRRLETVLGFARLASETESKVALVDRLLRRTGEPAIVFTEYRDSLYHLARALAHRNPVTLHGGLTAPERLDAVARFTRGSASLLLATDAASEGLNLHQRCRLVVTLELPWSPLRLQQRVGRVERLGQTRRVHAIHLVGHGTPEEQTVLSLAARRGRVDEALAHLTAAPPTETEIASAILMGAEIRPTRSASESPAVRVPALREEARHEAVRLATTRRLAAHAGNGDERAVVTELRRRGSVAACNGYRLLIHDADGDPIWNAVMGISASMAGESTQDLRQRLAALTAAFASTLAAATAEELARLAERQELFLTTAIARETAIADQLRSRRGRLAAELAQRSLFDRRSDNAAAERARIVAQAIHQCDERLRRLKARRQPAIGSTALAFALFTR